MSLFEEAVKFALNAHSGMQRKTENTPYILHPLEAAVIVAAMTDDEEVLAAAVLFGIVRFGVYKALVNDPPVFHVISLLVGLYIGDYFSSFVKDATPLQEKLAPVSVGVLMFFLTEALFAFLLRFAMDAPHAGNFLKAVAAVLPLLFTVVIYVPSETYFNNQKEFIFIYADFAPYMFIKTIVFTLLAACVMCCLREKVFRAVSLLAAGLTLCVYCQYIFLNSVLPNSLDELIDWNSMQDKYAANGLIWCGLLLVPFIVAFAVSRIKPIKDNSAARNIHLGLTCFIGGIQLITLTVMILNVQVSLINRNNCILSNREQFVVSGKKNVITFIIDNSDRTIFDEVKAQYPEKFDCLKDFTYYDNAAMMYDSTQMSIPQMLSGTSELPDYKMDEWLEKTWSAEPCEAFYSRLHENNYKVNVFGEFCLSYDVFKDKFDNCRVVDDDEIKINKRDLIHRINSLAAMRFMPLGLKSNFDYGFISPNAAVTIPETCIFENGKFMESLKLTKSDSDSNYFIVQHIMGTHLYAGKTMPNALLCMDILESYFSQLKEMGLYDDAVIIVTGDHGWHNKEENFPICYIKTAGAQGDGTAKSSAPISHTDYPATCIQAAGLSREGDKELFGRSAFEIGEDEERQRLVFQRAHYTYSADFDWNSLEHGNRDRSMLGYYFTGGSEKLAEHEKNDPPDIVIELDRTI